MRQWLGGIVGTGVLAAAVALLTGAGQAAATSTLAAQWHMDEAAGATTMADSSGNGNTGTLHNVTAGVTGKVGKAYSFGGSTVKSYVEVPDSPSLNPNASKINISLWLNTTTLPNSGDFDLVRKGDFPGQEYKVELLPGGIINCEVFGASAHVILHGGSGLGDGKWHHINCIACPTGESWNSAARSWPAPPRSPGPSQTPAPVERWRTRAVTGTRASSTRCRSPSADATAAGNHEPGIRAS